MSKLVQKVAATRRVLVVGAGIIGLTTAIRLQEAGHAVTIVARETPETIFYRDQSPLKSEPLGTYTSSGSGGFWMPIFLEGDKIQCWATVTYNMLLKHAKQNIGVSIMDALFLCARKEASLPWYSSLSNMKLVTPEHDKRVPQQYKCALKFTTAVVQMNIYMCHLQSLLKQLGVPIHLTREIGCGSHSPSWDMSLASQYAKQMGEDTIIVNCAGVGAGLISGEEMIPGRGILLRVKRPPQLNYVITENEEDAILSKDGLLAYAIPRGDEMLLGGTIFKGDWSEQADDEDVAGVRSRAEQLLPIQGMEETGRWSGLRPLRSEGTARVMKESDNVISNYGHGGSGVSICWGCAEDVVSFVNDME